VSTIRAERFSIRAWPMKQSLASMRAVMIPWPTFEINITTCDTRSMAGSRSRLYPIRGILLWLSARFVTPGES
jgi:hypothetical protein